MKLQITRSGRIAAFLAGSLVGFTAFAAEPMKVDTTRQPIQSGLFQPTWQSLAQYQAPDWFRDAKFGIWAHWGPQCQPERGDWYGRGMYRQGSPQNLSHVKMYGPPSTFGFKDVIHTWKAENWDPEKLVALYKRAGAQYFFAMANHHDNFDLWDSHYQAWNSVNLGPQKNIIAGWAKAAHEQGLRFGVSVHSAHAWNWYDTSQGADRSGPLAGVPYDGKLNQADGKGTWWEGYDPQALYAQSHVPGLPLEKNHGVWNWDAAVGASIPDAAYCQNFYDRTMDLINQTHPDLIYFDDTALPLWPVSDAGLNLAAHFYNQNMLAHGGKLEAVIFGKGLDPEQRKTMVWDIERGASNRIEPLAWQTDTCLGNWHYDRGVYDSNQYKSAALVIHTLADVVSKNGNLLLNVPVRGDGTIDEKETAIVEAIGGWMDINQQAIFGTRPFKVFGEGPATEGAPIAEEGFNEGKGRPFTAEDVRYTRKDNVLYAIVLGVPTKPLDLKAISPSGGNLDEPVANIELLGSDEKVAWTQSADAITIAPPSARPNPLSSVFKLTLK